MHEDLEPEENGKSKWLNISGLDEALAYPQINLIRYAFGELEERERIRLKLKMAKNEVLKLLYVGVQGTIESHHLKNVEDYKSYAERHQYNL